MAIAKIPTIPSVSGGKAVIQRGDKSVGVKLVQEWLTLHGFPVEVDQDFGPATERAVIAIRGDWNCGFPGDERTVDVHLWQKLWEPMISVLVGFDLVDVAIRMKKSLDKHAMFRREVIEIAAMHLTAKAQEIGQNRGPWVRLYMDKDPVNGHDGEAFAWCFSGDVSILTESGWIKFDELDESHGKVAQVDQNSLEVSFALPQKYIRKKYDGVLHHVKNRDLDFVVDPDHRFLGRWPEGPLQMKTLADSRGHRNLSIPTVHAHKGNRLWSNGQLDMIAAFMADGNFTSDRRYLSFIVSRERKIDALRCLSPMYERLAKRTYGAEKACRTEFRFEIPSYFDEVFDDYKKLSWRWIWTLTQEECSFLIERYVFWDGHNKYGSGNLSIKTTRKRIYDALTAICTLAGYIPHCKVVKSHGGFPGSQPFIYRISFTVGVKSRTVRWNNVRTFEDKRTLYCVQVPKGAIIVRDAVGSPFVTGNCGGFVGFCIAQALDLLGLDNKNLWEYILGWSCNRIAAWAHLEGTLLHAPSNALGPGSVFLVRRGDDRWVHTGFVTRYFPEDGVVTTIEGNTNSLGSANGVAVMARYRSVKNLDFIVDYGNWRGINLAQSASAIES